MLKAILQKPSLITPEITFEITKELMNGNLSPAQIGAFLTFLKLLGLETEPSHIVQVAKAMQEASLAVDLVNVVDIVGTGGDGQDTFNVSTASSIVVAGAGVKVAKHGNRASSSSCGFYRVNLGSADVLEALECKIDNVLPQKAEHVLKNGNFCFLFAQTFHPAMKFVAGPRRDLGVRTIFNMLGPLTNPAKPKRMIVGVFSKEIGMIMAQTLALMEIEKAWVVCGAIGLDEISPEGITFVWELQEDKNIKEFTVCPADFGLPEHELKSVKGGDAAYNSATMTSLLNGTLSGPVLDFVLLNSAALLFVAGKAASLKEGVDLARQSLLTGSALKELHNFALASRS